jgi:hypothetical protein
VFSRFSIVEPTRHIPPLKYLLGYPPELLAHVSQLITEDGSQRVRGRRQAHQRGQHE